MTTSPIAKHIRVRPLPRKDEARPQSLAVDDLIRKRPLARRLGISPWTLSKWCRDGAFPLPIPLSSAIPAWRVSDVEQWLAERARKAVGRRS